MKRRAVLRSLLAVPAAAALPADVLAQEVRASPPETPKTLTTEADSAAVPIVKTFDSAQLSALRRLGEILMPAAQDTPGALEAGAAEFLDFLIGVSPPDRATLYRSGLDRLNAEAAALQPVFWRNYGGTGRTDSLSTSCALVVSRCTRRRSIAEVATS